MKYLIIILAFSSCMTQRKAEQWMDNHKDSAAAYYTRTFPIIDSTVTVIVHDTVARDAAVDSFQPITDSLLQVAEDRNQALNEAEKELARMQREKDFTDGAVQMLQHQLASIPRVDTNALRKRITAELLAKIPIPATIKTDHFQESSAKVLYTKNLGPIQMTGRDNFTGFTNYGDLLSNKMESTMGNTVTISQAEMDQVTPEKK